MCGRFGLRGLIAVGRVVVLIGKIKVEWYFSLCSRGNRGAIVRIMAEI
jgi:hypothetical protein